MNRKKPIVTAIVGNALEYYDVTLYGFFAVFLAPLFFPSDNQLVSTLSSFGAFAAAFFMRPIGGLVFGYFGDRLGRRKVLLWTLILMSFPTVAIGLLPTYNTIGVLAPILLILFRLLQGFCAGGEYGGAAIYINEHAAKNKDGFAGSLLSLSGFIGGLLGTSISAVFASSFFPAWCWRIPFIIGGVLGIVGFFLRRHISESPVFEQHSKTPQKSATFMQFLKLNSNNLLVTFGIGATAVIPYYILAIYMTRVLTNDLHFSLANIMVINSLIMLLWVILLPIAGYFSDKLGQKKLMMFSSILTLITAYPLFYYIYADLTAIRIFIFQTVLSIIAILFVAPTSAFLPKLFQVKHRYLGIAFSYSLGAAILGGTTPLIAGLLSKYTQSPLSPALYLAFSGVIGIISLYFSKSQE